MKKLAEPRGLRVLGFRVQGLGFRGDSSKEHGNDIEVSMLNVKWKGSGLLHSVFFL